MHCFCKCLTLAQASRLLPSCYTLSATPVRRDGDVMRAGAGALCRRKKKWLDEFCDQLCGPFYSAHAFPASFPCCPSLRALPCAMFCQRGKLCSRVRCRTCRNVSDTHDPFETLSLEIGGAHSVEQMLQHFTSREYLDGDNRYLCEDHCKSKVCWICSLASYVWPPRSVPRIEHLQRQRFVCRCLCCLYAGPLYALTNSGGVPFTHVV